jgi:hypothetical protein
MAPTTRKKEPSSKNKIAMSDKKPAGTRLATDPPPKRPFSFEDILDPHLVLHKIVTPAFLDPHTVNGISLEKDKYLSNRYRVEDFYCRDHGTQLTFVGGHNDRECPPNDRTRREGPRSLSIQACPPNRSPVS